MEPCMSFGFASDDTFTRWHNSAAEKGNKELHSVMAFDAMQSGDGIDDVDFLLSAFSA